MSASSLRWKLLGTRLFKYLSDFLCQLNSLLTLGTWDRAVITIPVFAPSMRSVFARLWLVDVNSSVHGQFDIVTTDETVKLRLPLVEFYSFKIRECWWALALFLSIVKWRLLLLENCILISPLNGQNFNGKIKTELEWTRVWNLSFAPFQTTKIFMKVALIVIVLLIGDEDDLNSCFLTTPLTSKRGWNSIKTAENSTLKCRQISALLKRLVLMHLEKLANVLK